MKPESPLSEPAPTSGLLAEASPRTAGRRSAALRALRWVGLLAGAALFWDLLRSHDLATTREVLATLGPWLLLALAPQALGVVLHGAAFRRVLVALGHDVSTRRLALLYLGADASRALLPGGPAVAEALAAWHLRDHFSVTWRRAVTSLAMKKALVVLTHGACLAALLLLAAAPLERLGIALGGLPLLPGTTVSALVLLLVGLLLLLASWRAAQAGGGTLAPSSALALGAGAVLLLGQWLAEIFETWLLLNLLGVAATPVEAALVELGGSLIRSAAFLVPGGLGVQDASHAALLGGLGLAVGAGALAFVLVKRARELCFAALGLAVLATFRRIGGARSRTLGVPAALPCSPGGPA